jgi:hypothetical protein
LSGSAGSVTAVELPPARTHNHAQPRVHKARSFSREVHIYRYRPCGTCTRTKCSYSIRAQNISVGSEWQWRQCISLTCSFLDGAWRHRERDFLLDNRNVDRAVSSTHWAGCLERKEAINLEIQVEGAAGGQVLTQRVLQHASHRRECRVCHRGSIGFSRQGWRIRWL